ncbi:AP2 domain transcription factor AP2X-5, putative [Babesia ovata]|uniref:AP2 domain transcription factor AP2X-5, putative n=1 Tax=Babesia ovata TaxID=189622 RepID=A0A2H6K7Q6_9APIC|nr:AP2 domain transcription factor AP2X-5, putative [Babesia ovata]GBE59031.1 AP2 domain transcription factor AP2X-5, putative [Babesia ovata]
MVSWKDVTADDLPYRASINPYTYEKCRNIYNHYFQDLDRLGQLETSEEALSVRKDIDKKIKVGAKPLSGVRGIYYTRGTWRVQYRGHNREVVSCVFNYDSKDVLIATFDLAFRLLRRVIDLGRQIKTEDGMVITELTEERLLDLDRRSRLRSAKNESTGPREVQIVPSKRIRRQRQDLYTENCSSDTDDSDVELRHSAVRKKSRSSASKLTHYSKALPSQGRTSEMAGQGMTIPPNLGCYAGKLDSFERLFHSYSQFNTLELISYLIDENRMRNMQRAAGDRRPALHLSNAVHDASAIEDESTTENALMDGSSGSEYVYDQDEIGVNEDVDFYQDGNNDWYEVQGSSAIHPMKPDMNNPGSGMPCNRDTLTEYDSEQSHRVYKPKVEETTQLTLVGPFSEQPNTDPVAQMQFAMRNQSKDPRTAYEYDPYHGYL